MKRGLYQEKHRPQYHFSPPQNWMNDPNGLVYLDGEYHLFYQHNPYDTRTGHLAWGHAVSRDLVHWQHLPVALQEHQNADGTTTMMFSGSAVVDKNNTSGFSPNGNTMVAIYSGHVHRAGVDLREFQSLAISTDKGRTFEKYVANPVLDIGAQNFRDPKVFWYAPDACWLMAVALPYEYKVQFYRSADLKQWIFLSDFGDAGDQSIIWECPDLFPLQVEHTDTQKWVLLVTSAGPHKGFMGMQYFVGDFDGQRFEPVQAHRYVDYGKDFFAAVTWNDAPHDERLLIGWVNNWAYGQDIPTEGWRSAQSLVRRLSLVKKGETYHLKQQPLVALQQLRKSEQRYAFSLKDGQKKSLPMTAWAWEATLEVDMSEADTFTFRFFETQHQAVVLSYDKKTTQLTLDRRQSGNVTFHKTFASVERALLQLQNNQLQLHLFVDHSLIEIVADDGLLVLSEQVFPDELGTLSVHTQGGIATGTFHFWEMRSIWE